MGGGASSLSVLWRKHVASTAQARGAALVPLQGGGGLPCGSCRRPSYPAFAPPVPPPLGLAGRVLPTGTVVWSVPHPLSAASPPCRFVLGGGGGGGRCPPLPTFIPHPWGGGGVCGGGGGGSLVVIPSLHACRRHDASTAQARGAAPVPLQGGGACLVAPVVALPTLRAHPRWSPRWGLHGACSLRARSCGPSRTLSPLPPHLAALSSGGGAGALSAPPYLHPPPLGGRWCVCGGGEALSSSLRCTHVACTTQARRRHEARHLSLCRGGACLVAPVVALPTLRAHPRWSPRWGLHGACSLRARSCGPSRTLSPLPPHPAALSSGGGALFAPPYLHPPPLGGRRCVGGGGALVVFPPQHARRRHDASMAQARGAALVPLQGGGGACRVSPVAAPPTLRAHPRGGGGVCGGGAPCRRPFVARMLHDASTTQARGEALGCSGGGGFLLWAFPPFSMV